MHAASVPSVLGVADGSFILLAVMVVLFFAIVFGYFTFAGSGINTHSSGSRGEAPGASGPSEAAGQGRSSGDTSEDKGVGDTFSTHGTG